MKFLCYFCRIVFLGTGLLFCLCCERESTEIGSDFFQNGSLDISSIDTVSVQLSTISFDSLVTGQGSRTLLGTYTDAKLGRISAVTYFLPALAEGSQLDESDIFDGLSVVLKYDGYVWYDTTQSQRVSVYQLKDEMEPASDGRFYNTTELPQREAVLGTLTFTPRPAVGDSIEIFLDQTFGSDFFTRAREDSVDFESHEKFQKYLKGFAVVPDTSQSTAILGFASDPELRLYYLDRNVVPTERKYIAYTTASESTSSRISVNRNNTKLKPLTDSRSRLPAATTDDEAYLQAGAGLAVRIDLPHLRSLKDATNFYMTKCVLQLQPVFKSYNRFTKLPTTLDVHILNYRNESIGQYSSAAVLNEDLSTGRDTYYEIDATAFVTGQMELEEINENALCLLLPDEAFRLGTDRVYFASSSMLYNTKLTIYYATIINQ